MENITFDDAVLTLAVKNGIGFTSDVQLTLTGINERGESRTIEARSLIPAGAPDAPVPAAIVFREDVPEFLNLLPQRVRAEGILLVGDGNEESIVATDHFAEFVARFRAPLDFRFESSEFRIGDVLADPDQPQQPQRIELDQETRDVLRDNIEGGAIIVKFVNRLPIGAGVDARFSATAESLFVSPEVQTDVLRLLAASVDENGLVAGPTESESRIGLDKTDLDFLANNPVVFSGVRVFFDQTPGIVRVRTDNTLTFIARLEVMLVVNEDLFDIIENTEAPGFVEPQ